MTTSQPRGAGVRRRIVFVTDIVTPYMVTVFGALAEISDLHVVFCSQTGTRGMQWEIEVPFAHEVIEGFTIRRRKRDATDFYLSPRILTAVMRARPEAIIAAGFSVPSLYAAVCARVLALPLLIQSDGTSRSEAGLGPESRLSRKLLLRVVWGAVANSQPAAERFAQIGFPSERIFSAPHVTDMSRFWAAARHRNGNRAGPLRLISVGRLIPRKGLEWLLRACVRAQDDGVELELIMVGDGPEEQPLRALADAQGLPVRWEGFVDQPELPALYADADVFAFPTLDDPFGMVLLEAAAAGLPVIASPHAGATADFVRDGVNGFVVEPTDTDAMAAAIARLGRDPRLRARMGEAAHTGTLGRSPATSATGYVQAVEAALAN